MSQELCRSLDRVIALLGAVLILATGVVFVAHDEQSVDTQEQSAAEPEKAGDKVQIKDFLFKPESITIALGANITFTNKDSAPHTATSGPSLNPDGVFDTDILTKDQSKTVKLTKTGTFAYYCTLHPFMKATVIVK